MFVTLLPFIFFLGYSKKHTLGCESKMKTKLVRSQIVTIAEDTSVRTCKIITLMLQVFLEVASIGVLVFLQMQRHSVDDIEYQNLWQILFRIPEKYNCKINRIREQTYFNESWDDFDLKPCNNVGDKTTCWTTRSIESTLVHSALLLLVLLSTIFTILELAYNVLYISKKPARRLTKKVSCKIETLFKRESTPNLEMSKKGDLGEHLQITDHLVQNEIRDSNLRLN